MSKPKVLNTIFDEIREEDESLAKQIKIQTINQLKFSNELFQKRMSSKLLKEVDESETCEIVIKDEEVLVKKESRCYVISNEILVGIYYSFLLSNRLIQFG